MDLRLTIVPSSGRPCTKSNILHCHRSLVEPGWTVHNRVLATMSPLDYWLWSTATNPEDTLGRFSSPSGLMSLSVTLLVKEFCRPVLLHQQSWTFFILWKESDLEKPTTNTFPEFRQLEPTVDGRLPKETQLSRKLAMREHYWPSRRVR